MIALYLEGVKRASYFLDALREATKPVVILKAGRTVAGSKAAESHTKSMAGADAIYEALFRKYQVYRADNLEELFDFAKALAYLPRPRGRRLMITTSSGGAAILAIDEAEKCGLDGPGAQCHPPRALAGDAAGPLRRGQSGGPDRRRHQRPGIV